MKIIITKDIKELSAKAADLVISQIKAKPNLVLGLPTGETPLGLYRDLIAACKKGTISFKEVVTFNLDEYFGLGCDDKQSYCYFMWQNFFKKINIKQENVFIPNGLLTPAEVGDYCREYEKEIESRGGLNLQILGIGSNGHLGFNEPGSAFDSATRVVDLSESTIKANSRFFSDQKKVPTQAITLGLKKIMSAKKVILLASGQAKAEVVALAVSGPITPDLPASILQRHKDVTFILDQLAAKNLK